MCLSSPLEEAKPSAGLWLFQWSPFCATLCLSPSPALGFGGIPVPKVLPIVLCGQGRVREMLLVVRFVVQVSPCSWESMSN